MMARPITSTGENRPSELHMRILAALVKGGSLTRAPLSTVFTVMYPEQHDRIVKWHAFEIRAVTVRVLTHKKLLERYEPITAIIHNRRHRWTLTDLGRKVFEYWTARPKDMP